MVISHLNIYPTVIDSSSYIAECTEGKRATTMRSYIRFPEDGSGNHFYYRNGMLLTLRGRAPRCATTVSSSAQASVELIHLSAAKDPMALRAFYPVAY